ncbi:MAG: organomercurial lyase [Actinomycetota bacterium]
MNDDSCDVFGGDTADATRRFVVAGFVALWRQETAALGALVSLGDPDARQTVEGLARQGKLELDAADRVVGIHGLTIRPTRHRIVHAGRSYYTWCALDAVGVPAALGIDAVAITDCPSCRAELHVALDGGVPRPQPSLVLWLPAGPCEHLMNDFCALANLFCSRQHLAAWHRTTGAPSGRELSLAAVAEIGRSSWADVAQTRHRGP